MGDTSATWIIASTLAVALVVVGALGRRGRHPTGAMVLREAGIAAGIFLVWQMPTRMTAGHRTAALDHARWIYRLQRRVGLPSEVSWQRLMLPHPLLVQASNVYYAVMHFGVMAAFLTWLFWRHRSSYPRVRTTVVLVTLASLLVQLIPVAPPRLLPQYGYVDTAVRYGQSVYHQGPGSAVADELSAVPSVHIAWALLVTIAVIRISGSRLRWLVVAHPLLTTFVVVVTANHFWFDAITAALLLGLCYALQVATRHVVQGRTVPSAVWDGVRWAPARLGDAVTVVAARSRAFFSGSYRAAVAALATRQAVSGRTGDAGRAPSGPGRTDAVRPTGTGQQAARARSPSRPAARGDAGGRSGGRRDGPPGGEGPTHLG